MTPRPEHKLDTANTRTCPFCAESIKREAKVCPRCRQWLTLRSIRNPAITVWVYGLPHLVIYALLGMLILTALNRFQGLHGVEWVNLGGGGQFQALFDGPK
jgi:predicted nucleic acid-binding Zn ribbon protein